MLPLILLLAAIALPIAWLASEFQGSRTLRIILGIVAIGVIASCVWGLTSVLTTINYNAWYGGATGGLISTSVQEIEDGNLERVLKVWRGLERLYEPTYENRARYDELVEEATRRIRGEVPIESGDHWDASMFTSETWLGHWVDGHGYWIVIDHAFDIVQSGQPRAKVHSVSVSPDFKVLKFKEGDQWLHTLTLKNKYEATYEWFDLEKSTVWQARTIHKLIRASEEQKRMTQQDSAANVTQPAG
jgi:hypothetical protein